MPHSNRIGTLVSLELLNELDKVFPARCARPDETHAALMYVGGARSVVDFLRSRFEQATINPHDKVLS